MRVIDGQRAGSKLYVDEEGYIYSCYQKRGERWYFRCSNTKCPGTGKAVVDRDLEEVIIEASKPHTHDAEPYAADAKKLRTEMIQRSAKESTDPKIIFDETFNRYVVLSLHFHRYQCPFLCINLWILMLWFFSLKGHRWK